VNLRRFCCISKLSNRAFPRITAPNSL
jgi:hypothetical protein